MNKALLSYRRGNVKNKHRERKEGEISFFANFSHYEELIDKLG